MVIKVKDIRDNSIFSDMIINSTKAINRRNTILGAKLLPEIVCSNDGIPIIDFYDSQSLENETSNKIIVDLIVAGHHVAKDFKLKADKKYYLFTNGIWKDDSILKGIDYEFLHLSYFLTWSPRYSNQYNTMHWFPNSIEECNNGKFCSLIGVRRPWRDKLVSKLIDAGLDDNFISYEGVRIGKIIIEDEFSQDSFHTSRPYLEDDYFNISMSIPSKIFSATSYCLIAESNMESIEEFHLTEKTIKCFSTGMPFVMASSYRFLKNLRGLGFRTYNELWDEGYDEIQDVNDRMDSIVKLCIELRKFDWVNARKKINEISLHNMKLLIDSRKILEPQIQKILETLNGH